MGAKTELVRRQAKKLERIERFRNEQRIDRDMRDLLEWEMRFGNGRFSRKSKESFDSEREFYGETIESLIDSQ